MIKLINKNPKELFRNFLLFNYQKTLFSSNYAEKKDTPIVEPLTAPAPVKSNDSNDYEDMKIVSTKLQKKIAKREPLVKNLFLGKVDEQLLPFPEVISRDDLNKLNDELHNIRKYFDNDIDTESIEKTQCIPKSVNNQLKELNLYGLNIPQNFDGMHYLWTESLIASESETKSESLSMILISHRTVCDILNNYGTPYQKDKYLSKLAQGSFQATEAIFESNTTKSRYFNTNVEYDDVQDKWILNGEKSFVINGKNSNLFLVLAETQILENTGIYSSGIKILLVDSNSAGVTVENPLMPFGCRASEYYNIKLKNVLLSKDAVIGDITNTNEIAQELLKSNRLRSSILGLELCKKITNNLTQYCIETNQCDVSLMDMNLNGNRVASLMNKIYSVESMIYYTAGLMDEFNNQDVDVEVAVTKLHTMENLWEIACAGLDFMGPKILLSGTEEEILFRNAAQIYTSGESIDSIKIFIGLTGLQHAGLDIYEAINKERNPLFYPGYMLFNFFQNNNIDSVKSKLSLIEHLHPSLEPAVQCMEPSIERLKICTNTLLARHGTEILEQHTDIKRLTEIVTLIYAMFTSLSRASRSYCIGLQYADYELLMVSSICLNARDRIKVLANEIVNGPFVTNDKNLQRLAKQTWKSKGYFSIHPITYNY